MSNYDRRLQLVHISWERTERISAITGSWQFDSKLRAHQSPNHFIGAFWSCDTFWANATFDTIDPQNQSIESK
jgi:hypothetical protein